MRLLDTSSYELTEFLGDKIPPYVILSHTWGDEEVLFLDIQSKTAQSKRGHDKLVGCCRKAAEDGFKWVWIDTCCIDKSSSAELSEAINSMYQWYRDSVICYVYLEDVMEVLPTPGMNSKYFTESRWFTRGWTLQELIAPRTVEFYTLDWEEIGTKTSLDEEIVAATGIPADILRGKNVSTRTVAERMSWASKRQTTRREDMAYCLMGLFQINMPLLYGEGDKSFMRLQEQILRQEEDYSILAWTPQKSYDWTVLMGCLASSPSQFGTVVPKRLPSTQFDKWVMVLQLSGRAAEATYGNIKSFSDTVESRPMKQRATSVSLTARGLRISLPIRHIILRAGSGQVPLQLAWIYYEVDERLVCVFLEPVMTGPTSTFARLPSPWLIGVDKFLLPEFELTEVVLLPSGSFDMTSGLPLRRDPVRMSGVPSSEWLPLELSPAAGYGACVVSGYPKYRWKQDGFYFNGSDNDCGVLLIECTHSGQDPTARFEVSLGVLDGSLWCSIKEVSGPRTMNEAEDQQRAIEDLEKTYLKLRGLSEAYEPSTISDRAVKPSINIPGMMVSAAIRPRPQNRQGTSQFILRVTVGELASREGWA
ncbi:hypothetical protein FALCPG4_009062 [Fusarium falciforme]